MGLLFKPLAISYRNEIQCTYSTPALIEIAVATTILIFLVHVGTRSVLTIFNYPHPVTVQDMWTRRDTED